MGEFRQCGVGRRVPRRWKFVGCVFDEANWALQVNGQRVPIESKPLELLRELLLHPGQVVSKGQLLDRIWPDVTVVEASLPTAVRKLRLALGDSVHDHLLIETVSGIGYRFAAPVEVEELEAVQESAFATLPPVPGGAGLDRSRSGRGPTQFALLSVLAVAVLVGGAITYEQRKVEAKPAGLASLPVDQREQLSSLRRLDIAEAERLLAAGWDVNRPYDLDRNGALNMALQICEWDPGHDRHQLLLMVRTLIEGGATIDQRNAWGDTPYSIASAERYCGPNHPVTKMFERMCNEGEHPRGERCLADYHRDASGKVLRQF